MSLLHVFVLSVVEGITEFLPISSTGHLILVSKLLDIQTTDFSKTFEIVIQLGAILAVVVLYFKKFISSFNLIKKLVVAFIPTAVVGFVLYPFIKSYLLGSTQVTVISLFVGGVILILFEKCHRPFNPRPLTIKHYFLIGVFQSFSVVPGVSRAAATIIGGLLMGLNREKATEFSFLLAVPTMIAASFLDVYKSREIIMSGNLAALTVGTLFSFIFAIIAVKFLIGYVKKHSFTVFGVYRIILALLFWLLVKYGWTRPGSNGGPLQCQCNALTS